MVNAQHSAPIVAASSSPTVDRRAIAAAYEEYGHALFRRARALLGNDDDAYEVVQEVFCQFWRRKNNFEGRSALFTYLYRIATNLSIDRLRRRKTRGDEFALDDSRDTASDSRGGPNIDSDHVTGRRAEALKEVIHLTAGLDRDVVVTAVLVHVDGFTQEEAAASLGVSRRTVGKRLKKFFAHTRKRVADD